MIFLGNSFLSSNQSSCIAPASIENMTSITISNGIYDNLFISKNANLDVNLPLVWDYLTILYAAFNGTLSAGNVDFSLSQVSSILIKRRIKGEFNWISLFEVLVEDIDDFSFERFDSYGNSDTTYEYALVPLLNGIEGNYNINEIHSDFSGLFIIEKDMMFATILEYQVPQRQRNISNSIVETMANKYPYVITNSKINYDSGTLQGFFVEINNSCEFKIKNGSKYRNNVLDCLSNGNAKILKTDNGRMWLVSIEGSPTESKDNYIEKYTISANWVSIGNPENVLDLYDNGFIDVDISKQVI